MSFSITLALAEKLAIPVLLRIDDLDKPRADEQFVKDIFETLSFLNISWDEGPTGYENFEKEFSQIHRAGWYDRALKHLREKDLVFACTCSRSSILEQNESGIYTGTCLAKSIPLETPGVSWRLKTDATDEILVRTSLTETIKATLPSSMNNFVVRKKDGAPSYQLASLIDDLYYGVDLIVRGEDLWPSTLAQLYLSRCLPENSFHHCVFYHHQLLENTEGRKLSKSSGDTSVQWFRSQGHNSGDVFRAICKSLNMTCEAGTWKELGERWIERANIL